MAETYLRHLNPEYLRYYFAAKLGNGVHDIDLSLEDFTQRVNADLVGKLVNIASRCAGFIHKRFDGQLGPRLDAPDLFRHTSAHAQSIALLYEQREYARVIREVMALADEANQYIDEKKPWVLAKDPDQADAVQAVCTTGINLFRLLMLYLKPVLPDTAAGAEDFLNTTPMDWSDAGQPLLDHQLNAFKPLVTRVDPAAIEAMVSESRDNLKPT